MVSSKLSELLESLTPNEIKRLGDFIKYPFFNKSKKMIRMYYYIKRKEKLNKRPDKKELHKYLYPNKIYQDINLRLDISDFVKLIEKFLIHLNTENINYITKIKLLDELRLRGAFKNYKSLLSNISKGINSKGIIYDDEYFILTKLRDSFLMYSTNKMKMDNRNIVIEISNYNDMYFIYKKLQTYNNLIISYAPLPRNFKLDNFLINEIVSYVEKNVQIIQKHHKLIYSHYIILKMIINFEDYYYHQELIDFFGKHHTKLDIVFQTYIFYSFNTQFINAFNSSENIEHIERFYKVIRIFEKAGFFERYKLLPGSIFHNCIDISLKIDKLNFAEEFYSKYQSKLDNSVDNDVLLLTKAYIYIYIKKFDNAIMELNKISMINYTVYLNARSYLARIYYEIGAYENLICLIDASKHFLNRNASKMGLRYNRFMNFFKYLSKLIKIKNSDIVGIKKLRSEIISVAYITGRKWFMDKMHELISLKK